MVARSRAENIESQLRAFEYDMAGRPGTRFERIIFGRNLIDRTITSERKSGRVEGTVVAARHKDRYLPSEYREDPQYSVDVMLAPVGDDIYGASLFNPTPGTYQIRTAVTQHHAGLLFQGCKIEWELPAGWSFADGHGAAIYGEFVSNPLVITRLASYSSGTKGWKAVVVEWYRP